MTGINPEQLWGTMTRGKHQLTRDRLRMQSQIESLLEDAHIKLATQVSDLLGVGSRRMWQALADGEADPARLAAMADAAWRATPEQLQDALRAAPTMGPLHRQILGLFLARRELVESHTQILEQSVGQGLQAPRDAVPTAGGGARIRGGFGHAGDRRSGSHGRQLFHGPGTLLLGGGLPGPGGVCGSIEKQSQSQGQPYATPPTARWLGHEKAIAHRLCRLTWKILQQGVRYLEYGLRLNTKAVQKRARRLLRGVRSLGCQVQITSSPSRA